jgi:hypothetical protein
MPPGSDLVPAAYLDEEVFDWSPVRRAVVGRAAGFV